MSRQVLWTNIILEEFIKLGGLTKEEEMIITHERAGRTEYAGHNEHEQS